MLSPEFDLVRLAGRAALDAGRAQAFASAARATTDWQRVIELGAHHRVLPLLHAHLRDHAPAAAPADVAAGLRSWARKVAMDVLFLSGDAARINSRLDADGVPYLVLKGPSLAEAYGGAAKRPFTDNDFLVRRSDFGRVERALLDLGFAERKRSDRQQAVHLAVYGEYTFGRAVGPLVSTVDVHTRIVPFGFAYSPDFGSLLDRARPFEVAGLQAPGLSWEDLFLTLCVNAVKDQWNRLRLAADLAAVAPMIGDWGAVRGRARDQGALGALDLSVLVTADLVGGSFPDEVLGAARRNRTAAVLSERAAGFLKTADEGRTVEGIERARFNLGVQDGLVGPLRYLGYTAVRRMLQRAAAPHGMQR